jgi:hypothetical protein
MGFPNWKHQFPSATIEAKVSHNPFVLNFVVGLATCIVKSHSLQPQPKSVCAAPQILVYSLSISEEEAGV